MADQTQSTGNPVDNLTAPSRNFYERARLKLFLSILYASCALMFLGFCTETGARSNSSNQQADAIDDAATDDYIRSSLLATTGGNGFACFCHLIAFCLAITASLMISPLVPQCGNNNEAKVLRSPQEV